METSPSLSHGRGERGRSATLVCFLASPGRAKRARYMRETARLTGGTTFFCHFFLLFGYLAVKRITFIRSRLDRNTSLSIRGRLSAIARNHLPTWVRFLPLFFSWQVVVVIFTPSVDMYLRLESRSPKPVAFEILHWEKASKVFKKCLHATALARRRQPCRFHTVNQYV